MATIPRFFAPRRGCGTRDRHGLPRYAKGLGNEQDACVRDYTGAEKDFFAHIVLNVRVSQRTQRAPIMACFYPSGSCSCGVVGASFGLTFDGDTAG